MHKLLTHIFKLKELEKNNINEVHLNDNKRARFLLIYKNTWNY